MPLIRPFFVLALAGNLLSLQLAAQINVRNAVADTMSSPRLMFDGAPGSGWISEGYESSNNILTGADLQIEAGLAIAETLATDPAYRLLASSNNRDWWLVDEGSAATEAADRELFSIPRTEARYLRFTSLTDEAVSWELFAGPADIVRDQLAAFGPADWGDITDPANIGVMLDFAFEWQMDHLTTRQNAIGWVNGAFYTGVSALYASTGLPKYRQAILDIGNASNWTLYSRSTGKTFYHADDHCIGQSWLELYMEETNPSFEWIRDVKERLDRIMADPLPGREDMNWCDALYMSPPNYVRLAEITGNDSYRTFVDNQWWDVTDFLYDSAFGLFYRDSSYFDDREPNGMPVFWSRGNGWVVGGLVRMLQHMPQDWPSRPDYIQLLREMSSALAAIQGEDGLWSSSLLYPEKYNFERETSGSAFFTYAMAWGLNEGILDAAVYGPVIEKAWEGLSTMLTGNGSILFIQQIGAGPALNNGELIQKDYGYGAFILAGLEMARYYDTPVTRHAPSYRKLATAGGTPSGDPMAWSMVDDFEQDFNWSVRKDVSYSEQLVPDPFDSAGSTVFSIYTGDRTPGIYRASKSIPQIPDGQAGTVYQRFSYNDPEVDVLFGIADVPVVENYEDYENGTRIYIDFNQLEARAGGSYETIGDKLMQLETWYETWTVIDNATDTYAVYLRGGSNYPEQVLLRSGIPFRNGTSSSIISYAVSYNTDWCEGTFYLDDIHVDPTGVNLSRPEGVRQPSYSPWSGVGRDMWTWFKGTASGELHDVHYPWIYHRDLGEWAYVHPQENNEHGYWIWLSSSKAWRWLPAYTCKYLYNPSSRSWTETD